MRCNPGQARGVWTSRMAAGLAILLGLALFGLVGCAAEGFERGAERASKKPGPQNKEAGTTRQFDLPLEEVRDFVLSSPDALEENGWERSTISPRDGEDAFTLRFSRGYACVVFLEPQGGSEDGPTQVRIACDDVRDAPNPDIAARNIEKDYLGVLAGTIAKVRPSRPPSRKIQKF